MTCKISRNISHYLPSEHTEVLC